MSRTFLPEDWEGRIRGDDISATNTSSLAHLTRHFRPLSARSRQATVRQGLFRSEFTNVKNLSPRGLRRQNPGWRHLRYWLVGGQGRGVTPGQCSMNTLGCWLTLRSNQIVISRVSTLPITILEYNKVRFTVEVESLPDCFTLKTRTYLITSSWKHVSTWLVQRPVSCFRDVNKTAADNPTLKITPISALTKKKAKKSKIFILFNNTPSI